MDVRYLAPLLSITAAFAAEPQLSFKGGDSLLIGEPAGIVVSNLTPGERVRLHAFRKASGDSASFHASAEFLADTKGAIDADSQPSLGGSYTGIDPRGFLWSGYPEKTPSADRQEGRNVLVKLERNGVISATRTLHLRNTNDDVNFTRVDTPNLAGYFAAPAGKSKFPVVILLHGSEGGSFDAAKEDAGLFAAHGFAAFSLIYFSWSNANIPQVPHAFDNLPVERIALARDWLAGRPEADINRIGIRGVSKGSEFALLAATKYPWIHSVAACVPTSLVWGSFGSPDPDAKLHSGFTFEGKPVANVPYGDYEPVSSGKITLAARHWADRKASGEAAVAEATIPIEKTSAKLFLAGGGEDAVWPSLEMSKEIVERLTRNDKASQVEMRVYPKAGHYICGSGASPTRSDVGGGGDAEAVAHAAGEVWQETLRFLKSTL